EPVVARPPSAGYRFQRLVRRNKLAFAAASAVAGALILGLGLSIWSFIKEKRALNNEAKLRVEADLAQKRAEANATHEALERQRAEKALSEARRASYRASIFAADAYLEADKVGEAQRTLDACEPSLRNWEWSHLRSRSDNSTLTINPSKFVTKFGLSPDGKW